MESLLTVRARRERGRLRIVTVDVDAFRALAEAFAIADLPTLVLLCNRQPVARIDGKATASQIDAMLESHLPDGGRISRLGCVRSRSDRTVEQVASKP
jgi:thioredoxin-like negative regulator of GroEL